ncbi:MAG: Tetraacyldisaccharide 4-kinase [Pseudomonadota bacterium]|jgi:tetraacyldisaccharide-1-P 4'-kinase
MKTALTERWRTQLELPLMQRDFFFALFSFFVAAPLSLIWSALSAMRAGQRVRLQIRPTAEEPWIISVGNVAVGGTGKSPIVRSLARMAFTSGFDVAILSRGYGREDAGLVFAALNAGDIKSGTPLESGKFSDESLEHALLLREELTDQQWLWIGQCSNRGSLLGAILKDREQMSLGQRVRPLVVLLDDGLSQVTLPVHHDVVVWDPQSLLRAPRWCLPFGPYRCGLPSFLWSDSIPRADVVVWSRLLSADNWPEFSRTVAEAREVLARKNTGELFAVEKACLVRACAVPAGLGIALTRVSSNEWPQRCRVVTGLARPHRFIDTLTTQARQVSAVQPEIFGTLQLPDHGELTPAAAEFFAGSEVIVTSLKDLCRWRADPAVADCLNDGRLFVLLLEIAFVDAAGQPCRGDFSGLYYREAKNGETNDDSP